MPETHDHDRHDTFMRLFVAHQPAVYAVIRAMVFHRPDADEVMQETAAVLWRRFEEFDPEAPGSRFDRWAIAVARNQVLYFRQKAARDRRRVQFSTDVAELIADTAAIEAERLQETRAALEQCIGKLPEKDRELIRLRYTEESSSREVANRTGRSESAVCRSLQRIYDALLTCIRKRVEGEA